MKRWGLLFLMVLSLTAVAQKRSKTSVTDAQKIDALCNRAMTEFQLPGMAIAVVKDGQVIHSKGYGVKEAGKPDAVSDATLFAIASNSKAFTSAALAVLVDEGKLNWDDKVQKYLPYFQLYSPYVSAELTVRDLLCHRSGLATFSGDLVWYGTSHSRREILERARHLEPVMGFRAGFGYSNVLFLAAGEIVAEVSGMSWDEFVQQRFFAPLNMGTANTSIRDFTPATNKAMPHNRKGGVNEVIDYVDWDNIGPAGSINASVRDMTPWMLAQLGKGTYNGKALWSEARSREMWEMHTPIPVGKWQRTNQPSRHFNGYGLGWELMEYGGEKIVSHGGGADGFISKTVLIPGKNIGFVILTNSLNSVPSCLTYALLDQFLNVQPQQDWITVFKSFEDEEGASPLPKQVPNTQPQLPMSTYAGTYRSELYGDVVVQEKEGKLAIRFVPTALFYGRLEHYHYDTFKLTWGSKMMLPEGTAHFVVGADGGVEELKVVVENPDFDFTELKLLRVKE